MSPVTVRLPVISKPSLNLPFPSTYRVCDVGTGKAWFITTVVSPPVSAIRIDASLEPPARISTTSPNMKKLSLVELPPAKPIIPG